MVRYSFLVRLSHPLLHAGLIPALSLITLFARERNSGESVRPICFAALRLMTMFPLLTATCCCLCRQRGGPMIFASGTRLKTDRVGITLTYHSNPKANRQGFKSDKPAINPLTRKKPKSCSIRLKPILHTTILSSSALLGRDFGKAS